MVVPNTMQPSTSTSPRPKKVCSPETRTLATTPRSHDSFSGPGRRLHRATLHAMPNGIQAQRARLIRDCKNVEAAISLECGSPLRSQDFRELRAPQSFGAAAGYKFIASRPSIGGHSKRSEQSRPCLAAACSHLAATRRWHERHARILLHRHCRPFKPPLTCPIPPSRNAPCH